MEDIITVKVKIASKDEVVEISAPKTQSVEQLKHQIAAVSSVPADKQRLVIFVVVIVCLIRIARAGDCGHRVAVRLPYPLQECRPGQHASIFPLSQGV